MGRPTSTPTAFVRNAFPPSLTVGQAREILPMPSSACTDEALAVFLLLGVSAETVGDITPIFKSFWSSKNLFSKRFLVGCGATPCKKSSLAVREAEPRNALGGCRAGSCEKRALVKYIVLLRDMLKCAINESAHVVVRKAVHHRLALTLESDKTRALQYS